ncbi:cell division cycle and apoptosis regulator protein 1-like [Aricia agestis]|uniref:cell division cycle and apoptosis regulator protein 1-like n=1 Tax=Aricia agestis TaxID=91739 RepID=UPI001C20C06E|nr:cell division cycle and apoptosis regulator protein 1-like [Aricia agestis]
MQTGSGTKNPPWARSNVSANMTGMNPQIMDANAMMTQQSMLPFQQTQAVFNPSMMQAQGGMAMPMTGQMQMNQMAQGQMYPGNVVAYPTPRTMNPNMYQQTPASNQTQQTNEQRVFTGTVTKTHNDFGFVDHDVFYQTSVCAKGSIPKVNDRVLVEATYNPNMPFKWNATRVQVLPKTGPNLNTKPPKTNSYNAVPPPANKKSIPPRRDDRRDDRHPRREDRKRSRTRSRSRSRSRREIRRDSPPRKRPVVHQPSPVKHIVRVPRIPLDIKTLDVPTLSQRYTNLYIPSDFFTAYVKWGETFPPEAPFSLNNPCSYHIMSKEAPNPEPNDAVLEPPDADYRFSAKVMLISMPTLESLYQKCGLTKVDEKDKRSSKSTLHPTRLIKFLVGQKGKGGENFAIGGPWSPSLDGEDPQNDPGVLIKTAIRTCKALTGIDLSHCTQWYRMVEFYYWREGSGGKSRLESVVLYLPDVWSTQPSRIDWSTFQEKYKAAGEAALRKLDGEEPADESVVPAPEPAPAQPAAAEPEPADKSQIETSTANDSTITIDENDDDEDKPEPTHYSKLDMRTIKVDQLRHELRARNVSCKGLRAQLVSRLSKLIKAEEEKESKSEDVMDVEDEPETKQTESENSKKENKDDAEVITIEADKPEVEDKKSGSPDKEIEIKDDDKKDSKDNEDTEKKDKPKTEKEIEEEKKRIEKEKQNIKTQYELPTTPHIIVHPSATAKGGKFTCSVATLSLLLDYRITDNKEHSVELFVFAEIFNEMLMRDFGFYIYKTLYTLPERIDDKKEKEKSVEITDKKDEVKKEENDKKDDKRDEKRESRKRERRASSSESRCELPPDPYLLLSLVYFDTARCGQLARKELHALFSSLGLQLARSQTRALLDRVCYKDVFMYKTLIQAIKDLASGAPEAIQDLPLDSCTIAPSEVPPHIAELEATIATGNRSLLPVFGRKSDDDENSSQETLDVTKSGVVMYGGRAIEVASLVAAADKWAGTRARLEAALEATRSQLRAARAAAHSTQQAERGAHAQLTDLSASLAAARARITSLTASSKIFHSTLKNIQSKVEAVVNIKYEDDDVVEIVNGPTKTEKETKEEKDVKPEVTEPVKTPETTNGDNSEKDGDEDTKEKEKDNDASENMDLDDK